MKNTSDTATLTEEYRGTLLDLSHQGYACVVREDGSILGAAGNPNAQVYYRSASKPLQALPVIARDLDLQYGLTPEETVIFSGSHLGEDFHMQALTSIFKKAGLNPEDLRMNPSAPGSTVANEARLRQGRPLQKLFHNCSGKHAALMLLQRALGGEVQHYWQIDSPAQKEVLRSLCILSEFPESKTDIGIDGCGVPVFAMPMQHIAIAFKNLACLDTIAEAPLREAARRYVPLIHQYPLMMRGTGYLCSLIQNDENIVAKGGANGVYGLGLKKERLGISFKLKDGTESMWPIILREIFRQIGYENPETLARLNRLHSGTLTNDNGTVVGHCKAVFTLQA